MVTQMNIEQQDFAAAQQALAQRIARYTAGQEQLEAAIPGLKLYNFAQPTEPSSYTMPASICLIGQGSKLLTVGDESYMYDASRYLITAVDLPVVANIVEASPDRPYLGLSYELDPRAIRQLMLDSGKPPARAAESQRGIAVSQAPLAILDAFSRLLDLLAQPADIPVLAPLLNREILYRLLQGEQGARLMRIAEIGSQSEQIARAIGMIRERYSRPFKVDELATEVGMSSSSFHQHFRATTTLSPLQFVKRLRLNEARRLMLMENCDAATAAIQVGYESASQFSREYSRQFGAPPLRDIRELQGSVAQG